MSDNETEANTGAVNPARPRRASWPLIVVAALFIIVPFLTWYTTWFGRDLSDADIAKYLNDEKNPRHMQHALSLVELRIERGDKEVRKFYPQVIALARNPTGEIRKTVAWVMGQDNTSDEFHRALLDLLADSEPLVRRNAALQLVRFGDASGRPELRSMLQPFEARTDVAGSIASLLKEGSDVRAGGLLARIRDASGNVQEFRSPVDGRIKQHEVAEGQSVTKGQAVVLLAPDRATVENALRALWYVGSSEDLPLIDALSQSGDAQIAPQAQSTARAIQNRSQSGK